MRMLIAAATVVLSAISLPSWAATPIETRQVQFKAGESASTVKSSLKGYQTIDYKLRARAGQTMNVSLKTSNESNNFNVLPPGSKDVAIFNGSTSGREWSDALPADGEYTVRLYLERSAARRNETASFTLTIGITGAAAKASAKPAEEKAAASQAGVKKFNATGRIPCAQSKGQPTAPCDFGVQRAGSTATVMVTRPDGRKRAIFFENGKAIGADISQADGNVAFRSRKQSDLYFIEVGDERYEIPEAVVAGG